MGDARHLIVAAYTPAINATGDVDRMVGMIECETVHSDRAGLVLRDVGHGPSLRRLSGEIGA